MKKFMMLAAVAVIGLSACKKETPDTQAPIITVTQPANDHIDKEPGETINIRALITDDTELLSAKIDIHEAGGHSHRVSGEGEWEWAKVYTISGTSFNLSEDIVIPADAEHGDYHITIEATDAAGNAATPVVIELHID
ncbi:MAG: DUF4625 domain-containing protein [Bacteroidia bacterium]